MLVYNRDTAERGGYLHGIACTEQYFNFLEDLTE